MLTLCLFKQLCGLIETHRLAVDHGCKERSWMMAFQPRREVGQDCERSRVGLRKAILSETFYLLVDLLRKFLRIASFQHAFQKFLAIKIHLSAAMPGTHCSP